MKVSAPTRDGDYVEVFTGTLEAGVPWMFWNRVRPDDKAFDLPPMFQVEYVEESSDV